MREKSVGTRWDMSANCRELIVTISDLNTLYGEGCYPASKLADALATNTTAIYRVLSRLEARGYIEKDTGVGPNPSRYRVCWQNLPDDWIAIIDRVYHEPRRVSPVQRES